MRVLPWGLFALPAAFIKIGLRFNFIWVCLGHKPDEYC